MRNFSVLILTYNEEKSIGSCIDSVAMSDDIVVLDSMSTDNTKANSDRPNVRFFERAFSGYSDQRNYGLHQIAYKNEYVLILDADERASGALVRQINKICNLENHQGADVYLIRRRTILEGKILKWNTSAANWIERLVRPTKVHYVGMVHEKIMYDGDPGFIRQYIIHDQFSKGIRDWIDRRTKYARMEATEAATPKDWVASTKSVVGRRVRIKNFFVDYVPGFYLLFFLYNLMVRFAFLDGYKGLKYVGLETYSFMLISKYRRQLKN